METITQISNHSKSGDSTTLSEKFMTNNQNNLKQTKASSSTDTPKTPSSVSKTW